MARLTALSQRRMQVLRCILEGKTNREIAEQLGISVNTAGVHIRRLSQKLGVATSRKGIIAHYSLDDQPPLVDFSSLDEQGYMLACLTAKGYSNKKLAEELSLSIDAIKSRIKTQLLRPFGFTNRYAFSGAFIAWQRHNPNFTPPPKLQGRRQTEAFRGIIQGKTNAEIARTTGMSLKYVPSCINLLLKRLRVASREELIRRYYKLNASLPCVDFGNLPDYAYTLAKLTSAGKKYQEIADCYFGTTAKDVSNHIEDQLLKPFGLKNRYELTLAFIVWEEAS